MAWDPTAVADYIRQRSPIYGIDPDTAVAVARTEGLNNPVGDAGQSFGPYQLYKGGGLGNAFQRETGLDPANYMQNWPQQVDWFLRWASQNGWNPGAQFDAAGRYVPGTGGGDHGASNAGIGNWQGINGAPGAPDTPAPAPATAGTGGGAFNPAPGGVFGGTVGALQLEQDPCAGQGGLGGLVCRIGRAVHLLTSPGFWWAVLLFGGALVAIVVGLLLYFHKSVGQAAGTVAKGALT